MVRIVGGHGVGVRDTRASMSQVRDCVGCGRCVLEVIVSVLKAVFGRRPSCLAENNCLLCFFKKLESFNES